MRYLISAIGFILCIIGIYYLELWVVNRSEENRIKLSLETIESSHRYTINDPAIAITLSDSLREISGLSYDPVSGQLLAIEDEHGLIYTVDKLTGKINNTREFAKDGDYEGIIYANKNIYILESNGHIFEYETDGKVKKYKTGLKKSFDFEGLTYLPDCNRLMLASKSSGPKTKSHLRKLFTFDLTQHTLDEEPPIILDCKDVGKELYKGKRGPTFSPSAITRDINHDLLILSSVAKSLIVIDSTGQIKSTAKLDPALHLQPEGITIDDQGILYIANEGKSSQPKLFAFYPKT